MIISYIDLPLSQLQTQQLKTSQIRSRIEYLMHACDIFSHFILKINENFSLIDVFNTI